MNYQDIIQVLYIILLLETFIILLYIIFIIVDIKNSIDKLKLTLDKFQTVGNKALDIADDLETKIKKIISFTDLLGDIPNIIKSVIFGKNENSDEFSNKLSKTKEKLDDESDLPTKNRQKIIRKRII